MENNSFYIKNSRLTRNVEAKQIYKYNNQAEKKSKKDKVNYSKSARRNNWKKHLDY